MYPMQDHSELGMLVRRLNLINAGNVVNFDSAGLVKSISAEDALVSWMLDLPDGSVVSKAAFHALKHVDRGPENSAAVQLFCDYLKMAMEAEVVSPRRRNGRTRKTSRS